MHRTMPSTHLGSPASTTTMTATIGSFPSPGRKERIRRNSISFGTCARHVRAIAQREGRGTRRPTPAFVLEYCPRRFLEKMQGNTTSNYGRGPISSGNTPVYTFSWDLHEFLPTRQIIEARGSRPPSGEHDLCNIKPSR